MKKIRQLFRNREVVVTSLVGGLGNQMFQYAAGFAAAASSNHHLILDTSPLADPGLYTVRPYGLDDFRVDTPRDTLTRHQLRRLIAIREEDVKNPSTTWSSLPDGIRLAGYWQCEEYFKQHRETLQRIFRLRAAPSPYVADMAQRIQETPQAVSLHIRRGDYISNPTAARTHGSCDLDYYKSALTQLTLRAPIQRAFVFTDDPDWARHNLTLAVDLELVDCHRSSPAQDIWLMSLCTHHVVANSSFSWWGAWLARNDQGLKFAPRRWFADPALDGSRIVPENWIRA